MTGCWLLAGVSKVEAYAGLVVFWQGTACGWLAGAPPDMWDSEGGSQ